MAFQAFPLAVFTAVMAVAAFEDLRRLTIPNLLPILLCAVWPVYFFAGAPSPSGALGALGAALAVLLAGALLFARGWLGGGDVKLLSAATLWAGPGDAPGLLMLTGILGGLLSLLMLMPSGPQVAAAVRSLLRAPPLPPPLAAARAAAIPVPYGIAIAGAGVIVVVAPHLG